jgi:hypothetical protein
MADYGVEPWSGLRRRLTAVLPPLPLLGALRPSEGVLGAGDFDRISGDQRVR